MKTYAKLEAGALRVMGRVPNIINPTDAQVAAYAAAHGFKELVETTAPGRYYRKGYAETDAAITETWTAWELEAAKEDALQTVQDRLDADRVAGSVCECEGLPNGVLCNERARGVAGDYQGMLLDAQLNQGPEARAAIMARLTWTDAADVAHQLTEALFAAIKAALFSWESGIQASADSKRANIKAAEDIDAVEAALNAALNA